MSISIGISPCPNDTFIFDKLLHDDANRDKYRWDLHLEDVETLNQWALQGRLDITKVSFATYLQVQDSYDLLTVGSALGYGVGPLLLSRADHDILHQDYQSLRVGIPGKHTTANLLCSLAYPSLTHKIEMPFHMIEDALIRGDIDLGLVIHESRFTYTDRGLSLVQDLGTWWEDTYNLPIPLGCILIKKSMSKEIKNDIEKEIQDSLRHSWNAYPALSDFVTCHAQEMSESVMRQHIELYVNDETMQLSPKAIQAIAQLAKVSI